MNAKDKKPNNRLQSISIENEQLEPQITQIVDLDGEITRRKLLARLLQISAGAMVMVLVTNCKPTGIKPEPTFTATVPTSTSAVTSTSTKTLTITPSGTSSSTPTANVVDLARQASPTPSIKKFAVYQPKSNSLIYMIPCNDDLCIISKFTGEQVQILEIQGEYADRTSQLWFYVEGLLEDDICNGAPCWVPASDLESFENRAEAETLAKNISTTATAQVKTATAQANQTGTAIAAQKTNAARTSTAAAQQTSVAKTAKACGCYYYAAPTATPCECVGYTTPVPGGDGGGEETGPCPAGAPIPGPNQYCGCDYVGDCICHCVCTCNYI